MIDSVKRTYRLIHSYLCERIFGKMVFMLFSRTFILFGIGLVTIPALFLFFYDSLAAGDTARVCLGAAIFVFYVVWVIWADKRRMLQYNRLFFRSEIRIHKSYIGKLAHMPYGSWRQEYDVGKAVNLIEDGTDELMMRFRDFVSLLFKGTAVALINVWILLISSPYVVLAINLAIVAGFVFSLWVNRKIAACEKESFHIEAAYRNIQRLFTENTQDYAMAGLGGYWKERMLESLDDRYRTGRKSADLNQALQTGMDLIDLSMYLSMLLYGLAQGGNMLSPLIVIMAYEMIKDVTADFLDSVLRIQKKVYAVEEFEKVDRLTGQGEGPVGDGGIELQDVAVEIDGNRILTDVNLRLEPGSKTLIVGDNGSGKTVLLKTILGFHQPTKGQVRYGEAEHIESADMASKMAYERSVDMASAIAYDPVERMLFPASIRENVNLYAEGDGYGAEEITEGLRQLLGGEYDAEEEIEDAASRFSLGQIDALCMLRTGASGSGLYLLDEPLAHADKRIFRLAWQGLMESDRTVIAVEHEFDEIGERYDPCIVWVDQGRIKAVGAYGELMAENQSFRRWRKTAQKTALLMAPEYGKMPL